MAKDKKSELPIFIITFVFWIGKNALLPIDTIPARAQHNNHDKNDQE